MKFAIAVAGCAAVSLCALPQSARGAETQTTTLRCGSISYLVTGFGRGEPLHLVGSNRNYVVTFARAEPSGRVLTDIPGQRDRRDIVTCTATAPSGTAFTFRGFFTPRG